MALVTLVVVGKDNSPLYLRDFVTQQESFYSDGSQQEEEQQEDPFGFFERSAISKPNDSSSLKHQFIIHSALDRFGELIHPKHMKDRPVMGPSSMYIGPLGCYDELKVYGMYVFNTFMMLK